MNVEDKISNGIVNHLQFCDGLRWHGDKLWFSDLLARRVYSYSPVNDLLTDEAYIPGQPSGLGHLSNGSLIVGSMLDRQLIQVSNGGCKIYVSLFEHFNGPLNDIFIDQHDRIYVGSFGFEASYEKPDAARASSLLRVDPDKSVHVVADDLMFPNGIGISDNGETLIVAETFANQITKFQVDPDGGLSRRQVFSDLGGRSPDGLCMDRSGGTWVGCPFAGEVVYVERYGNIETVIPMGHQWAVDAAVGGTEQDTLFVSTAHTTLEDYHHGRSKASIASIRLR